MNLQAKTSPDQPARQAALTRVLRTGRVGLLTLLALVVGACRTVEFYAQAVGGQVEVLSKRRPIDKVMTDTPDRELRERLRLTRQVLAFARDELHMPSGGSYELYTDLKRDHLVWLIYAAPELSLEPKKWWYPVVGHQHYRGYFREELARAETRRLESGGYETWTGKVNAFSTLGWFRDPVLNTFVDLEEVDYVELIFHELCHRKHYVRNETSFNEGMAEAVAREGVRRWFHATGRPALVKKYEARLGRLAQMREAIETSTGKLETIYTGTMPDTTKRELKQRELDALKRRLVGLRAEWNGGLKSWIEEPINNARLISFTTYESEVGQFTTLLDECGGDFPQFWVRVRELP